MDASDRGSRPGVELEEPSPRRAREFVAAALRSRALHRGLVTAAATPAEFRGYLERSRREGQASFLIVTAGARDLVGVVEILDIAREPPMTGRLGYYAFVPHAGRGLMSAGIALALERAFMALAIEELTAEVQRSNRRSIAMLKRFGFRREGGASARKVGRRWLDHERWVLSRAEWCRLGQRARARA